MGRRLLLLGGGGTLVAALAFVAFSLSGSSGASTGGYDSHEFYPPRTDPLVIDLSGALAPPGLPPSGQLNESIARLGSRGGKVFQPLKLAPEDQQAISTELTELFGTPAAPKVAMPEAADLGLSPEKLAAGSRAFKLHCVQCHGMTGDGRGPTSLWTYPPARDFRQGQFKFVSTGNGLGWPTRSDIQRVIRRGIGGNSMPPFDLLNDADIDDATSYTLHLMFRGMVEFDLIRHCAGDPPENLAAFARRRLQKHFGDWVDAQTTELKPKQIPSTEPRDAASDPAYGAQIRRGHDLFRAEANACATCHVDYGRGSALRYDLWGVAIKPANLTLGNARGGSEGIDLFRRLRAGIVASGMPPASQLSDEQVWDLVVFLRALPDPRHLPPEVREAVYPGVR